MSNRYAASGVELAPTPKRVGSSVRAKLHPLRRKRSKPRPYKGEVERVARANVGAALPSYLDVAPIADHSMTGKYLNRPYIFLEGPWIATDQLELKRLLTGPLGTIQAPVRLWLHALSRANQLGHAEFAKDELRDLFGYTTASGIRDVVHRAKVLGLLDESSTVRCLVLPTMLHAKDSGSMSCAYHRITRKLPRKKTTRTKETR